MVTTRNAIQRLTRLTPLPDALACLEQRVLPVAVRDIAVGAALGRTLATDIVPARNHPAGPIALRDGWAVRAEQTLDAGGYSPVPLAGAAVAVEIGDAMPAGSDAVLPVDAVEFQGSTALALATIAPGDGVVPGGADAREGAVLLSAGRRVARTEMAVLAAIGCNRVGVREPRVRVASARAGSDVMADTVMALMRNAVEAEGAVAIGAAAAGESADVILAEGDCDAIIVVGGSGAGRRDHSVDALARLGEVAFHGVGLTPGETAAFGSVGSRPVLIVPGRLDAALAVWLVLGRRMVARLAARTDHDRGFGVRLTRKITSTVGLAELNLVRREADGDGVAPLASSHLSLQSLARADGWILVPPEAEGYPPGAFVEMRPLP
jgi:molybdopterin molybdotransferase